MHPRILLLYISILAAQLCAAQDGTRLKIVCGNPSGQLFLMVDNVWYDSWQSNIDSIIFIVDGKVYNRYKTELRLFELNRSIPDSTIALMKAYALHSRKIKKTFINPPYGKDIIEIYTKHWPADSIRLYKQNRKYLFTDVQLLHQ